MIDFKGKLNAKKNAKITEPCSLYSTLDRKSVAGPLRPVQDYILTEWYTSHREDRDLIIKLHTGDGKTLIGLLILQSMINSNGGPCIYVCPNIYLTKQVCEEAEKFGIPYCTIGEDNVIPNDFINGEKLLVTHAQKIFNGKSIFGIDNNCISVDTVILDDSHACIETIKNAQSIKIKRTEEESVYNRILSLFEDDLIAQREGSFLDIKNGDFGTFMAVPYWTWIEKKQEILKILNDNISVSSIQFVWPIIRDRITDYCCFVSGSEIEIVPYNPTVESFGVFSKAKHRVLMSATTQDDSFFIKGLAFDTKAVKNPLFYGEQKWSGEKMIIIPSLINDDCDREFVVTEFSRRQYKKFGAISIVPNTSKLKQYKELGALCADKTTIYAYIDSLKSKNFEKLIVINNRYDGIDLPDESCRILIMDSMPYLTGLSDRYEKDCRPNSEIINKRTAQKIEQGLGRGVRGEKDYCAILIVGSELVKFLRSNSTKKYFSTQTQKQIDIGLQIAEMSQESVDEGTSAIAPIIDLINQMLKRDEGWKEYYVNEMNSIEESDNNSTIYEQLLEESQIEKLFSDGEYEKAAERMRIFIDKFEFDSFEKGWYLQQLARYFYFYRKEESMIIQKAAFKLNKQLLKPQTGIDYDHVSFVHENRMNKIIQYINKYPNYNELALGVDAVLENLSFGTDAEKFESAVKEIGDLLGFISQRPDRDIRKGPDNLWCGTNNEYAFFECKSHVEETREEISKSEAGQMNNHCGWFEDEYGADAVVNRYLIIPTKNLSYKADFTHDVRIIRKGKLRLLKNNIKRFVQELKPYDMTDLKEETLQMLVDSYKLNLQNFRDDYSEAYYHIS